MRIRNSTSLDRDDIRDIHMTAFPDSENQLIATLATELLNDRECPGSISLLAEADGVVIGHVVFSPVTIRSNNRWTGYILAPLGVKPGYQKRQAGTKLVERGIELVSKKDVNVLFVYGDPDYYGRFGFKAETALGYLPPYELQYPFGWQAIMLREDRPLESGEKISCVAPLNDPALW